MSHTTKAAIPIVCLVGKIGDGKSTAAQYLVSHGYVEVALADPLKRFCAEVYGFTEEQLWGPSELRETPHSFLRTEAGDPLTARYALQQLGTEWGRKCNPSTWLHYFYKVYKGLHTSIKVSNNYRYYRHYDRTRGSLFTLDTTYDKPVKGVVVSDVRFKNEAEFFSNLRQSVTIDENEHLCSVSRHFISKEDACIPRLIKIAAPDIKIIRVSRSSNNRKLNAEFASHASEQEQDSITPYVTHHILNDSTLSYLEHSVRCVAL